MSDNVRAAIYSVFTAILGLLSVLGLVNADEQAAYTEAGAQVLATIVMLMAAVKTFRRRSDPPVYIQPDNRE
jgi:uncharacterized membrane protein